MATAPYDTRILRGEFWSGDPYPALRWLRENDPVFLDEDSGIWAVTLHEDILAVEREPNLFVNSMGMRPHSGPTNDMISLDPPEHTKRRRLVSRGFTPRRVADLEPRARAAVRRILDEALPTGRCDFVADVASWLPIVMIGELLGFPPEEYGDLLRWSDELLSAQSTTATPEMIETMMRAYTSYRDFVVGAIADRKDDPELQDLLGVLVHAEIDGESLDDEQVISEALLLLIGGDETTRHVISGGMLALIEHPDQLAALRADPGLLPGAIEEMLRWVSPIKNMARGAARDAELRGRTIRQGEKMVLLYPSANRDETVFTDPDRFDIRRDPNPHLAFGGRGPHFCLGASLARLELRVLFEELLDRGTELELLEPPSALPRRPSNFVSGLEEMPVQCPVTGASASA